MGHGLRGPGDRLYLATSATASPDSTAHAVPWTEVRNALSAAAVRPVVILDCCFSGRAEAASYERRWDPYLSARPDGSFLLTSAMGYQMAYAPEGERHTVFTGELLRLLEQGDAGGPRCFTLADLHRHLDQRLQGARARPRADFVGRIGDLPVARNPAYAPTPDPVPEAQGGGPCPYPGMRPFLPEEHELYFGREELTRELTRRASRAGTGPVLVVGPSGAGKSSLLRAGLGPGLAQERPLLLQAPGARPFAALAQCWAEATGRPVAEVKVDLAAGRFRGPADGRPGPGVLVVDQLEEIFTLCGDQEERDRFVRALTSAGASVGHPSVVLALRADYFGHCLADARLEPLARHGLFSVGPLTEAELAAVIEKPAVRGGLRLEEGFTDVVLRELRQEFGGSGDATALPFLAHVLQKTWTRREGTRLTIAGYHATGGVRGSVEQAAREVTEPLTETERIALRRLLMSMVRLVDRDGTAVRRRVDVTSLGADRELLDRLVAKRLVVVDGDQAQLCHDFLLGAWTELRGWIDEDRQGLHVHHRLRDDADRWHRGEGELYRGRDLRDARRLVGGGRYFQEVGAREREFVARGIRRHRVALSILSFLVLTALLLPLTLYNAAKSSADADRRKNVAIAQELVARADEFWQSDPATARKLSLTAYGIAPDIPETRGALLRTYVTLTPHVLKGPGAGRPVLRQAFSGDGRVLAVSMKGGLVRLWDLRGGPRRAGDLQLGVSAAIAFHPTEPVLAAQNANGLTLWDVTDPRGPERLAHREFAAGTTYALAFSPDGRQLAAGSDSGRLRLWDVRDPASPGLRADRKVADSGVFALSYNRNGRLLATAELRTGPKPKDDAAVRLWDVRRAGRPVLRHTLRTPSVTAVAFHPKRDWVLAGGHADVGAQWWTAEDGRRLRPLEKEDEQAGQWWYNDVASLAFRPDGGALAVAERKTDGGGTASTRKVVPIAEEVYEQGRDTKATYATVSTPNSVAYSPDGRFLATGDVGGEVRLWPTRADVPAVHGTPVGGATDSGAFSTDGRFMVTQTGSAFDPGIVRVWDIGDRDRPRALAAIPDGWETRGFVRGRKRLTLLTHHWEQGDRDHVFRLRELGEGDRPLSVGPEIRITARDVMTDESPDGTLMAVATSHTHDITLWDIGDLRRPRERATLHVTEEQRWPGKPWFLDDRTLAVEESGGLRLWDVSDADRPRKAALVRESQPMGGSVGLQGKILITELGNDRVQLWDMKNVQEPKRAGTLPGASQAHFLIGKDRLVTGRHNGLIYFWDISDPSHPENSGSLRGDKTLASLDLSRDGKWALTSAGTDGISEASYRLWKVDGDGSWQSPAHADMSFAKSMRFLPGTPTVLAVTLKTETSADGPATYLLDIAPESIHDRLCAANPAGFGEKEWKQHFPHLPRSRACD